MTIARSYSLVELCRSLRACIAHGFDGKYWIHAETLDVRTNESSGHCYLELVQKGEDDDRLIARMRASMWRNVAVEVCSRFKQQTGMDFASGMEVMLLVSVSFHEQFGLSLVIHNIDPAYTLGDLARRRREIVDRLKHEGLLERNRELPLPRPVRSLAIISSASAAGYGDFVHHLSDTTEGFVFYTHLYPAVMQGEQAERSILVALERIVADCRLYDAVVVIRGGGAVAELSCFDSYAIARAVALFPLPVICGIGHDRDCSVLDIVASVSLKTPTAVADYLISSMRKEADMIERLAMNLRMGAQQLLLGYADRQERLAIGLSQPLNRLMRCYADRLGSLEKSLAVEGHRFLQVEQRRLSGISDKLPLLRREQTNRLLQQLTLCCRRIAPAARQCLALRDRELSLHEQAIRLSEPKRILERGFVFVTGGNGLFHTRSSSLEAGERVCLHFADGQKIAHIAHTEETDEQQ
ncbi:hypothetical protein HQ45_06040 [Porphyromonas crevioricanis]|uniref:Exodeoxyribonuclease 7 large subunit n=2 Tax=Porphyromonas crevioricanis TaxID=393921 RepID=A0A0A2FW24_9PORP|nr:exodeoxyribonuclease VII large subunit [Porphyromonas crevioricanis]KGN90329.1 hypothetical protein HQ45_06040 [Porphyromonas crevioricanis]KGN95331.1 hypothetical protein HQ38_03305 [Porphyromonas crevioricanis]SJZ59979.1 Exodeoxyribonuclease VII large subunit [Porphyromonas crevioricanis]SQH72769.1 Exodeoxyribonuclease 7 large subunit [Porphyromonas crevioricanis]GAD05641.1 exodeoxyribonuclease VII large subunit [Porphyromonas crevioricanis JCM 15906]